VTGVTQGTPSCRTHRLAPTLVVALVLAALVASLVGLVAPQRARAASAAEVYPVPGSGTFQLSGLGFGHGIGMSQFGAEGMGRLGKSYRQILKFYYPDTRIAEVPRSRKITVGLSGLMSSTPQGTAVVVRPRKGLTASGSGGTVALPRKVAGEKVRSYRVVRHRDALAVWAVSSADAVKVEGGLGGTVRWGTDAQPGRSRFTVSSAAGTDRTYRGQLDVTLGASSLLAVNRLLLQDYLRSVVSSEVPSSWTDAALRAQAVAARSYALLAQENARAANRAYDICDTTYCQVYSPVSAESSPEAAAVKSTAGVYLRSGGQPVFAMFSSANGGYSVSGSRRYLVAQPDPYDGVVTGSANWGHSWSMAVSAGTIERAWPQIGRLQKLKVLGRDGNGAWGGRVLTVGLVGSRSTVSVSADSFRWATGLKSTWWTVTNGDGSASAPVTNVRVKPRDRSAIVRWAAPATERTVRGYRVTVSGTDDRYRVDRDSRRVRVRGLTNGQEYRARVTPLYRSGPGPKTSSAAFVPTAASS
jgi:SpoIID/LytB domain protein